MCFFYENITYWSPLCNISWVIALLSKFSRINPFYLYKVTFTNGRTTLTVTSLIRPKSRVAIGTRMGSVGGGGN